MKLTNTVQPSTIRTCGTAGAPRRVKIIKRVLIWTVAIIASLYLTSWLLVSLSGCPSERQIAAAFSREHPGWAIDSVFHGDGDFGNIYYCIRYRKPGDSRLYEEERLYQNLGDKTWTLTWRTSDDPSHSTTQPTIVTR